MPDDLPLQNVPAELTPEIDEAPLGPVMAPNIMPPGQRPKVPASNAPWLDYSLDLQVVRNSFPSLSDPSYLTQRDGVYTIKESYGARTADPNIYPVGPNVPTEWWPTAGAAANRDWPAAAARTARRAYTKLRAKGPELNVDEHFAVHGKDYPGYINAMYFNGDFDSEPSLESLQARLVDEVRKFGDNVMIANGPMSAQLVGSAPGIALTYAITEAGLFWIPGSGILGVASRGGGAAGKVKKANSAAKIMRAGKSGRSSVPIQAAAGPRGVKGVPFTKGTIKPSSYQTRLIENATPTLRGASQAPVSMSEASSLGAVAGASNLKTVADATLAIGRRSFLARSTTIRGATMGMVYSGGLKLMEDDRTWTDVAKDVLAFAALGAVAEGAGRLVTNKKLLAAETELLTKRANITDLARASDAERASLLTAERNVVRLRSRVSAKLETRLQEKAAAKLEAEAAEELAKGAARTAAEGGGAPVFQSVGKAKGYLAKTEQSRLNMARINLLNYPRVWLQTAGEKTIEALGFSEQWGIVAGGLLRMTGMGGIYGALAYRGYTAQWFSIEGVGDMWKQKMVKEMTKTLEEQQKAAEDFLPVSQATPEIDFLREDIQESMFALKEYADENLTPEELQSALDVVSDPELVAKIEEGYLADAEPEHDYATEKSIAAVDDAARSYLIAAAPDIDRMTNPSADIVAQGVARQEGTLGRESLVDGDTIGVMMEAHGDEISQVAMATAIEQADIDGRFSDLHGIQQSDLAGAMDNTGLGFVGNVVVRVLSNGLAALLIAKGKNRLEAEVVKLRTDPEYIQNIAWDSVKDLVQIASVDTMWGIQWFPRTLRYDDQDQLTEAVMVQGRVYGTAEREATGNLTGEDEAMVIMNDMISVTNLLGWLQDNLAEVIPGLEKPNQHERLAQARQVRQVGRVEPPTPAAFEPEPLRVTAPEPVAVAPAPEPEPEKVSLSDIPELLGGLEVTEVATDLPGVEFNP